MTELDLPDHHPHQALLAQHAAFLAESRLTRVIHGLDPIQVIDPEMEHVPETAGHVRHRDIHPAHGVDDPVHMAEIEPGEVVDLDVSQVLDGLDQQVGAPELLRVLEPRPAMPSTP